MNFKRFEDITKDCYLFVGMGFYKKNISDKYNNKKKILLTFEEPNFCRDSDGPHEILTRIMDEILTICPYTAELDDKRTFVFIPFNEQYIPKKFDKIYDIIYFGYYPRVPKWNEFLNIANKYKFIDVHYSRGIYANCSYKKKIDLYSKSKIALVYNILTPYRYDISRYVAFPNSDKNRAFREIDNVYGKFSIKYLFKKQNKYKFLPRIKTSAFKTLVYIDYRYNKFLTKFFLKKKRNLYGLMPQLKSRVFEAAFSKSLILCYKDRWRIIERFFEENKEFLYFTDSADLSTKLEDILNNYDDYLPIVESAYNKAINNYTTRHFIEKYIGFIK